jgi:hypothetical protein
MNCHINYTGVTFDEQYATGTERTAKKMSCVFALFDCYPLVTALIITFIPKAVMFSTAYICANILLTRGRYQKENAETVVVHSFMRRHVGGYQGSTSGLHLIAKDLLRRYEAFIDETEAFTNKKFREYFPELTDKG